MSLQVQERIYSSAHMIFDVEDRYARDRGLRGPHPPAIGRLRFWLVGTVDAGGSKRFPHPDEMVVVRNAGGYYLFFDKVIPWGRTQAIRRNLTAGTYIVRVTSELEPYRGLSRPGEDEIHSQVYQWLEREDVKLVDLPASGLVGMEHPYPLPLEAGYAYPFPFTLPAGILQPGGCQGKTYAGQPGPTLLRGSLHHGDGSGAVGGIVSAPGAQSTYRVDSSGEWVLIFNDSQASGPLTVTVTLPGQAPVGLDQVCVIQGFETGLPETALRGWVLRNGAGISGAQVQVTGLAQALQVQTGRDGGWMLYLPPQNAGGPQVSVTVQASLPDGSQPLTKNVDIRPRSTILVPTFAYPKS
jgi:hypothetical protein